MLKLTRFALLFFSFLIFTKSNKALNGFYFQQDVKYKINVTLDDHSHYLRGEEELIYKNNSRDTLRALYFHLWPNAYSNDQTVLAKTYYNDADKRFINAIPNGLGFIDSLDFNVDGSSVRWELLTDTPDVARLTLHQPLLPGNSLQVRTPFRIKIPDASISRFGHNGQAYFVTQWYPKPAVYDDGGWKYFPYIDKGEFYSEFGKFDVNITLPKNYVVGATGVLVDGERETTWLQSKAAATASMKDFKADSMSFPESSAALKTLHFTQDSIHDFAWFADKRWNVLLDTVQLPKSKKVVKVQAFFTNQQAKWWMKSTEYMKRAVLYYSKWLGEYPYQYVTAADVTDAEGSGMEYPMITAIGTASNPVALDNVLAHELGHNWLYGILGNDERHQAWMDEGINSFYEKRYMFTAYAGDSVKMKEYFNRLGKWGKWTTTSRVDLRMKQYLKYLGDARNNTDQSPSCSSEIFTLRNYSDIVYGKTSLGFQYLLAYLGDSLLDNCMQRYYETWKFRHPKPADLKNMLESTSGKNLDWFFNDWMSSTGKLDYKVCNLTCSEDSFRVTLKNKGEVKGPLVIVGKNKSGDKKNYWMDGFEGKETITLPGKPYSAHLLDPDLWMPEVNRKNNAIRTDGLLRKVELLQISLLIGNENTGRSRLFVAPAAGWNLYNGVMAGGVIHNVMYPQQKFEFALMPLFAFGTKDLAGGGFFTYRIHPIDHWLKEIRWRSGIQHYAYQNDQYVNENKGVNYQSTNHFTRLENRLALTLRNSTPRNRLENSLTVRQVMVIRDLPYGYFYRAERHCYDYYQVELRNSNNHPWNGYLHTASITGNKDFVRLWLTGKHLFPYADKKKGIEISGRAGWTSIKSQHAPDVDYRFRLGGWSGKDDYLFDGVFLGRTASDGIFSQQFLNNDGGFSMNTGYYRLADTWMAAATIKAALPGKLPISVYSNLATFNGSTKGYSEAQAISMEGGIEIQPIKDIFVIYVPLVYSKDIQYVVDREKLSFGERIRFQLNFNLLNPLEKLND